MAARAASRVAPAAFYICSAGEVVSILWRGEGEERQGALFGRGTGVGRVARQRRKAGREQTLAAADAAAAPRCPFTAALRRIPHPALPSLIPSPYYDTSTCAAIETQTCQAVAFDPVPLVKYYFQKQAN